MNFDHRPVSHTYFSIRGGSIINSLYTIFKVVHESINPCHPGPCGPHSQCRAFNGHAVCSCTQNYIGSPPNCRPECMVSSDCGQNTACMNQKCVDPCPGTCGMNAQCKVINHNPICSCTTGYSGDPFVRCVIEESKHLYSFLYVLYFIFSYVLFYFFPLHVLMFNLY